MKFHANRGVFIFLMAPYFIFVIVYAVTANLDFAKNLLVLPVLYALWVVISLFKAIRYKYKHTFNSRESKEEAAVLILSITPWIGLPFIDYFNLGQAAEASITNIGFLLLLALQVKRHIMQIRAEHQGLIDSELQLKHLNTNLQQEVDKKTQHLEKINEERTNSFVNLAHETKTPLTLINNYLEEYINTKGTSEELTVVKRNIDKLSNDIINFFDLERFNKGFAVYNHDQVSNFSEILRNSLTLFKVYARKRKIEFKEAIEEDVFIKADPEAIDRIINNLIENAIKFSGDDCEIEISLHTQEEKIIFSIRDCGIGIPPEMHQKVFEPYYQINNQKGNNQGMGLGLPLVKKVIHDLRGKIKIDNPEGEPGTIITVTLSQYQKSEGDIVAEHTPGKNIVTGYEELKHDENIHHPGRQTILLVEDNVSMVNYLMKKLNEKYNVYAALNGSQALIKIKHLPVLPDLIISDVMMDKLDGFAFVNIISKDPSCSHIPVIFLSAKSAKDDRMQGLRLGAFDFIRKPFSITELLFKIDSILRNTKKQKEALLTSALNQLNIQEKIAKDPGDIFNRNCVRYKLTSREKDIARMICEGHTYKAIATALYIAERTVTKHAENIFEKADVSTKVELINKLQDKSQ